ncbi:MAG: YeeE/YedE family protein [Kofleriaceae bacterium]
MLFSILRALAGGALVGLAASVALIGNGRIAGISGTLGRAFDTGKGRDFRVPFLVALLSVGALAFAVAPSAFGAPLRSTPMLALAGLCVGVGTALANGCTSGHGVCGLARLSPRSLVAVATFMLAGGVTVALAGARA